MATVSAMALKPCPSSPNCVSSQAEPTDSQHYMAPVDVDAPTDEVLDVVQTVLDQSAGARIKGRSASGIESVFTTRVFRFEDDVSFLVEGGQLHFRSASRVGRRDLGANRKRMTALVSQIKARL